MTPEPSIRILSWLLKRQKPTYQLSLPEIKERNAAQFNGPLAWIFLGPKLSLPRVVNSRVTGRHGPIPVRLYYPRLDDDLPVIVFFHGGGWVTGSLETHDRLCRRIAKGTGALIMAVDYRLAPWHKYPIPLEDCYDAVLWASSQAKSLGADANQLVVMGDSAGGNMAAAVCLMARDLSGPKIHRQILLYPAVDGTLSCGSHQRYGEAPLLTQTAVHFFRAQYMKTLADTEEAYFSPLLAKSLEQLPPAFILTAEYDPLHDEAEAFAEQLSAAGGTVIYKNYPGMVHAFLHFPRFCSGAAAAFAAIVEDIKTATSHHV
ncbi:MAG: alpha/beta hydrolase [Cyanobacteria bacterium P01_D01_bin.156]